MTTAAQLRTDLVATCKRLGRERELTEEMWRREYDRLVDAHNEVEKATGEYVDLEALLMMRPQ